MSVSVIIMLANGKRYVTQVDHIPPINDSLYIGDIKYRIIRRYWKLGLAGELNKLICVLDCRKGE